MSVYLDKKYAPLEAYTPGEQPRDMKYVKLNTNECPFPPAPGVFACMTHQTANEQRLYPDPQAMLLRTKLAECYGLKMENVTIANGSDDILNFAFMAYGAQGVAFADICYGFNKVFASLHGANTQILPLKDDFSIDPEDYCGLNKTIFIDNPNAPTGRILRVEEIEKIIKSNPANVVVVDEAYVDFGAESCLPLIEKYENLLIVRTFSKSRALAGARLGFAMAQKPLIDDLELLRYSTNPYNVSRMSLLIGEAVLNDPDYFELCRKKIIENRAYAAKKLGELGFGMTDSYANFIFAKHAFVSGMDIYKELKARGVLIRHFETERLKDYNRISIGTREEMDVLIEKLKEIIKQREEKRNA